MTTPDFDIVADLNGGNDKRPRQDRISRTSKISAHFSMCWQSEYATHIDSQFLDNLNVWRDFFPAEIEMQLDGCSPDQKIHQQIRAGEALPEYVSSDVHTVKQRQFNRHFSTTTRLEPRLGRFYPKAIFDGIPGNYSSNYQPCRIIGLQGDSITADFNHPLAAQALEIEARIIAIWEGGQEHGGRCNDIVELLTTNGPGMQARYHTTPTDFWSDDPFARQDASADDAFYAQPRLVHHLDRSCSQQIGQLYKQLLPHDGVLLDLMSSWVSHLPESFSAAQVTGLGMNQQELARNPMLDTALIHDLNRNPQLPFAAETFDGIICTASIEYLISPQQVFSELGRILKPGAPLVMSFSNRWFPPKAIQLWGNAHEFERIGLVLEYFIENGRFEQLHSYSLRGLPRPYDDKYADQLLLSDPVCAVWGTKR